MARLFDVTYWENTWSNITIPQLYRPEQIHELHKIFSKLLPLSQSFIEIGCAPGRWMAYFARYFNYSVHGVEYAPNAADFTYRNLKYLEVPMKLYVEDFFSFNPHHQYDVVFSAGFVEHFTNPEKVLARIFKLAKPRGGIVITVIPSMTGVNRFISKMFRPLVAAGHLPISRNQLQDLHESLELETLYIGYIGCLRFLLPVAKTHFAFEHNTLASIMNFPFRCWNKAIDKVSAVTGIYPSIATISTSILYIGKRA